MEALGAFALLLGFGLFVAGFACTIWAIVHAARRADQDFRAAGQSKVLWLVLLVLGMFAQPLGLILSVVYVVAIRPKVDAAALRGRPHVWGRL